DPNAATIAYVFKTLSDPFTGRINYFRVYQGTVSADSQLVNCRTHQKERIGSLLVPHGKDTGHADEFVGGDIGAVGKLEDTQTGDVLGAEEADIQIPTLKPPA